VNELELLEHAREVSAGKIARPSDVIITTIAIANLDAELGAAVGTARGCRLARYGVPDRTWERALHRPRLLVDAPHVYGGRDDAAAAQCDGHHGILRDSTVAPSNQALDRLVRHVRPLS
jgi:hypothetical protein